MSFDDEQEAFDLYADAMPDNSTLLVDTYDSRSVVNITRNMNPNSRLSVRTRYQARRQASSEGTTLNPASKDGPR